MVPRYKSIHPHHFPLHQIMQGHSTKSREWETPAKNLQSSVAILSSEITLFSDLLEFVGSCRELSGVVRSCQELSGVVGSCQELSGVCRDLLGLVGTCQVGTCWEFVGTCRDLSGLVGTCQVGTCRELSGLVGSLSGLVRSVIWQSLHSTHVE